MAAVSTYPVEDEAPKIVRGDPLTIPVYIKINGVPQDVTGLEWRSQVRKSADGKLVTEFSIESDIPPDSTVRHRLLLSLTEDQTRLLTTGNVFDLEQIENAATPTTIRTWWIVTKMYVIKDVSHA